MSIEPLKSQSETSTNAKLDNSIEPVNQVKDSGNVAVPGLKNYQDKLQCGACKTISSTIRGSKTRSWFAGRP